MDWFRTGVIGSIFVITFCLISGTAQFAFADNIFSDSFVEHPDENGWEEEIVPIPPSTNPATGDIFSNEVDAVLLKTGGGFSLELSITRTVDTRDYENISVKLAAFQDENGSFEKQDFIRIQYDLGDGFKTILEDHQRWNGENDLDGELVLFVGGNPVSTPTDDLLLPDAASNNEFLKIKLTVFIDDTTKVVFFDHFEVMGTPLQQNNPPIAEDDFALTSFGESVTIDVLANDSDEDLDELTVVSVTLPSTGDVVINGDNSVTYTPNENFLGLDTFTYTISDGTDTATATVNVKEKDAFDLLEEFFDWVNDLEDSSEIKNPGSLVSQAANLLKMLEGADKATHDEFIDRFHEFKDLLKQKLREGKVGTLENMLMENELDKMELKLKMESSKILENNNKINKIQTAVDLGNQKEELIKIKNLLGVAQHLNKSPEKDKIIEKLELEKVELIKEVIILDAKHNDKKITTDFLKKLDEKITQENEGKKSQKDQKQDDKGNNSKKSDNKDKGNSSKGKSKNK